MISHANSRPEGLDLALIGLSTRALARSARLAGLRALTLDLFADADTCEHAACAVRVSARLGGVGIDAAALLDGLEAHAPGGLPVVFGAGFEDATQVMHAVARRRPIRGASPDLVRQLKDPFALAALLKTLGIEHPDVADVDGLPARARREGSSVWLSKRIGASGGGHIRVSGRPAAGRYLQRLSVGTPLSALFLADGRRARIVGFSEQWTDPMIASPFRYGGAVGPVAIPATLSAAIAGALDRIVAETGLMGLASADLLTSIGYVAGFTLLEINPRPGATLDVFEGAAGPSLLAAHLAACDGRLPDEADEPSHVRAAAVVYAPRAVTVAGLDRPGWTADWPADTGVIRAGAPVCTVLASASSPKRARALVERRRAALIASLPSARRKAAASSWI